MNLSSHRADGCPGRGLNLIAKSCAKADGAKDSELVFLEASVGIADRSYQPGLYIGLPSDVVDDVFRNWIKKQTVNGEIAPEDVLPDIGENNSRGAAAINICF